MKYLVLVAGKWNGRGKSTTTTSTSVTTATIFGDDDDGVVIMTVIHSFDSFSHKREYPIGFWILMKNMRVFFFVPDITAKGSAIRKDDALIVSSSHSNKAFQEDDSLT